MKINNDHRRAVAVGWHAARERGEDQASYCSRQVPPIRPRTLRQWAQKFAPRPDALSKATDIKLVYAALTNLRLLADALEQARLGVMAHGEIKTASPIQQPAPTAETTRINTERGAGFWDDL